MAVDKFIAAYEITVLVALRFIMRCPTNRTTPYYYSTANLLLLDDRITAVVEPRTGYLTVLQVKNSLYLNCPLVRKTLLPIIRRDNYLRI